MTPIVWTNVLLAVPFVLAWVGIPLWMVIKRPETATDHSEAHAYLAATRPRSVLFLKEQFQDSAELTELQLEPSRAA